MQELLEILRRLEAIEERLDAWEARVVNERVEIGLGLNEEADELWPKN